MKERFIRFWKSGLATDGNENDQAIAHSWTGRILGALTLIIIIFCLAVWITAFLLLKDRLFTESLSGNILTNLTCITFFGGLAFAIFTGALAGNLLRRAFWKMLVRKRSKKPYTR